MGHEQQERGSGHLLLFPFLAQGHLIPFLNLAKRLESLGQRGGSGHRRLAITIVSTPRNVASLHRALPAGSSIGFAELPFSPSDHGLPPDAESADAVPLHAFPTFTFATELLQPSFEKLLTEIAGREGRKNVCVLADMFLGWTAETARALGVQHRMFLTNGAYASAVIFSIWLRPPSFPRSADPDDELALADFPDVRVRYVDFLNVVLNEDYGTDRSDPVVAYLCRMVSLHLRHSSGLVINTSEEIEPKGLHLIVKLSGLPTFAVGPVIGVGGRTATDDTAPDQDMCIKFLDSKPQASVLYVSFGSQSSIPASQMMELARGWRPAGVRSSGWCVHRWSPTGPRGEGRGRGQGVVVRGWAPQMRILAHASTGAFLSHCGWNSVLESLWHGVPVVGWPLIGDQLFDSRVLVELGVGVEVASGRCFGGLGSKGSERVRDVVETVLGDGDKAKDMRRKAAEMKKLARAAVGAADGDGKGKGSSVLAMERLVDSAFD
ncbi:unnamed protein product [Miscanthus lutarioriparius]|uniref:Glycosyltransferase n=1 Tax=Miscanthus lutarioriparius TaxID=422564 RepID=A0A811M8G4_9POAL|nr:unnamed protein product [Miscanthus lutarioriparius]